ncbi:MAG: hypothetical protein H0T89_11830 [Deltaproteobacteria bacterium]|nr:hypothetical protein [Deltaproteobacteria bacterium]
MKRLALTTFAFGSMIAVAVAQPATSPKAADAPTTPTTPTAPAAPKPAGTSLPVVGETLPLTGAPGWPVKRDWLYDAPALPDAAGKIVLHWFCGPKVPACADDLARVVTLKENTNRVYVVAYINGTKGQAKKLDPIRESEGVGRGTLAFGKHLKAMFKKMAVVGPVSVVVDVDGKVALVTTGSSPAELDARDAKVNALTSAIKEYTATSEGPKLVKINERFQLMIAVKLASWLQYSKTTPMEFKLTAPKELKCDATTLKGDQLKLVDQTLTAQVGCSGSKGSYEVRGQVSFGYTTPSSGAGLGTESANWKFEIK